MRVLIPAAMLIGVFVLPASVFAGGSRQEPYGSLFTAQLNNRPAPPRPPARALQFNPPVVAPSASAPTIVCGMTVTQGDASIDTAIAHRVPANAPTPLITVVPPPTCKR
jgi:hypothetical protein